jgi:hypothetical protein
LSHGARAEASAKAGRKEKAKVEKERHSVLKSDGAGYKISRRDPISKAAEDADIGRAMPTAGKENQKVLEATAARAKEIQRSLRSRYP